MSSCYRDHIENTRSVTGGTVTHTHTHTHTLGDSSSVVKVIWIHTRIHTHTHTGRAIQWWRSSSTHTHTQKYTPVVQVIRLITSNSRWVNHQTELITTIWESENMTSDINTELAVARGGGESFYQAITNVFTTSTYLIPRQLRPFVRRPIRSRI